jgi:hypothetical protein
MRISLDDGAVTVRLETITFLPWPKATANDVE